MKKHSVEFWIKHKPELFCNTFLDWAKNDKNHTLAAQYLYLYKKNNLSLQLKSKHVNPDGSECYLKFFCAWYVDDYGDRHGIATILPEIIFRRKK